MQKKTFPNLNIARVLLSTCCAAAFTPAGAEPPKSLTDSQILGVYIQVNGFDIETALLGRAQAKSESVRKLAGHVASDHVGVRQQAYKLAEQCKVPIVLPAERDLAAVEHGEAMTRLLSLSGDTFDKAYIQHEVAFPRSAIDAVREALLPAAACPALKAHLTSVLPAFEHHLSQTEAIEHEGQAQ
jgi:putative membrane protein